MFRWVEQSVTGLFMLCMMLVLVGCGSQGLSRAPVVDKGTALRTKSVSANVVAKVSVNPPPGFENAGKPGYYTVKPGDTLAKIGLEHGQSFRDIARWNNIENPNRIEVGQVVRVEQPLTNQDVLAPSGAVIKPIQLGRVSKGTPLSKQGEINQPPAVNTVNNLSIPEEVTSSVSTKIPSVVSSEPGNLKWVWPTQGKVLNGFDEVKNKGIDIDGIEGAPVIAAADGRVVYVGSGLRGYGNLIILKHNNIYLTAYAHNKTLLIKEDEMVTQGQKIAEMGSSDTDRVKLHFEVRRQGKPVDPVQFLPPR